MKDLWANNSGSVDLIIWIVVAVLWGLAQMAQARRKRRAAAPPPPPGETVGPALDAGEEEEAGIPRNLREFFEALSGDRETSPPPPPPVRRKMAVAQARPRPPAPPPFRASRPASRATDFVSSPPQITLRPPGGAFGSGPQVAKGGTMPEVPLRGRQPSGARGFLVDLSAIRVGGIPRIPIARIASEPGALDWMHDWRSLRRAMLSRLVLGPPAALPAIREPGRPPS